MVFALEHSTLYGCEMHTPHSLTATVLAILRDHCWPVRNTVEIKTDAVRAIMFDFVRMAGVIGFVPEDNMLDLIQSA